VAYGQASEAGDLVQADPGGAQLRDVGADPAGPNLGQR